MTNQERQLTYQPTGWGGGEPVYQFNPSGIVTYGPYNPYGNPYGQQPPQQLWEAQVQRKDGDGEWAMDLVKVAANTATDVLEILVKGLGPIGTAFILWKVRPLRKLIKLAEITKQPMGGMDGTPLEVP